MNKRKKRSKKEDRIYKCKLCGKTKEAKYPSLKKDFCSYKCSNQWKWNNLYNKGAFIECFVCGLPTWKPRRYLENPDKYIKEGIFCSKKCFYKFRKDNVPEWLQNNKFNLGRIPWNKGISMDIQFKKRCKERAKEQWKELSYREKQMKRDLTKFHRAGAKALKEWRKKNKPIWTGKDIQERFLKKLGVK